MKRTLRILLAAMLFSTFGFAVAGEIATSPASQPAPAKIKKSTTPAAKKKSSGNKAAARLSKAGRSALLSRAGSGWTPQTNAATEAPYTGAPVDVRPIQAVRSPALRKVHPIPPPKRGDEDKELHHEPVRPTPPTKIGAPAGSRQAFPGAESSAPTAAGVSFDGVGVGLNGFNPHSVPPDVNGRVGATQYVQWNNTSFAVFSKTGTLLYGPAAGNTLFQSLGGVCASHNDGDPVVSYDILASRWVLSQFVVEGPAGGFSHQCFAVSMSDDALGSYYLYDFVTDPVNFVDYPHVGVWPDGYYMTTNVFNPSGTAFVAGRVHVFEREKMIAGLPARQVQKDLRKDGSTIQYGFLPADLDSVIPPPAGEASFVIGPNGEFTNQTDTTRVAVTWGTTPTIALTEAVITGTGITTPACVTDSYGRDCVPQPPPSSVYDYLDNISFHYMYRLAYRNFGGSPVQESLLVSAPTAGSASTPGHGAIQWIEFRNAGSSTATPTVFQSGTFDPDTSYRWLPSIAMDKDHNIALGYSKSSTTIKPGIYLTGRLGTDPVNAMGAETTMQAGAGSQTGAYNRWGDYSSMTLDPIDQCTFWYTNEYLKTNGGFNWSTRIATYKFPSCTPSSPWGTLSGTITSCATGAPLSGITVTLSNGFAGISDASGNYSIHVPAGTYTASAAGLDRSCTTSSPATVSVIATSGATTTQTFCMTGASNLETTGTTIDDASSGNSNGIVNRNECIRLNVALKNTGCSNETAISATLSTATAGVTVTQASAAYPDLALDASGTNITPFKFQTSSSFVCGTMISFTLTTYYASGSGSVSFSIPTCTGNASQSIPSSSLTSADLIQSDRIFRDGVPSTCAGKAATGGGFPGPKYYKTFTFTNNSGVATCYTVNLTAALGGDTAIESVAYSTTYNPSALNTNFLGDSAIGDLGTFVGSASYSFTVPALTNFVIVVNTIEQYSSSVFSGTVSGFVDTTAGPGACPACVPPATPTVNAGGPTTFCTGGSVTLTSSSASGNQWYLDGNPIGGETQQQYVATATGGYTVIVT
ncbi:MAG: hypothetical protein QOI98_3402, partial [Solirubrobacteraceae bacterium]|nr:hypothetical protein [Solirubrobacteraceae bacterium]